ncbi:hypothetical protein ADUPG1_013047 [Aduncisulcus paluster]|uniref:Uncharacterized protein n=1 Tax=Aduncisulcus paluster TaxID=2918883 RepID=A0ABQ5K1K4_9EUKA|nr:hypothetical protein ADUPG1_013047 [Aduncisulcus paluster]
MSSPLGVDVDRADGRTEHKEEHDREGMPQVGDTPGDDVISEQDNVPSSHDSDSYVGSDSGVSVEHDNVESVERTDVAPAQIELTDKHTVEQGKDTQCGDGMGESVRAQETSKDTQDLGKDTHETDSGSAQVTRVDKSRKEEEEGEEGEERGEIETKEEEIKLEEEEKEEEEEDIVNEQEDSFEKSKENFKTVLEYYHHFHVRRVMRDLSKIFLRIPHSRASSMEIAVTYEDFRPLSSEMISTSSIPLKEMDSIPIGSSEEWVEEKDICEKLDEDAQRDREWREEMERQRRQWAMLNAEMMKRSESKTEQPGAAWGDGTDPIITQAIPVDPMQMMQAFSQMMQHLASQVPGYDQSLSQGRRMKRERKKNKKSKKYASGFSTGKGRKLGEDLGKEEEEEEEIDLATNEQKDEVISKEHEEITPKVGFEKKEKEIPAISSLNIDDKCDIVKPHKPGNISVPGQISRLPPAVSQPSIPKSTPIPPQLAKRILSKSIQSLPGSENLPELLGSGPIEVLMHFSDGRKYQSRFQSDATMSTLFSRIVIHAGLGIGNRNVRIVDIRTEERILPSPQSIRPLHRHSIRIIYSI